MTTGAGVPVGDKLNLQTVGPRGPLLVQDVVFTDEMAHFDRERIPERVVHAKGAGILKCIHRNIRKQIIVFNQDQTPDGHYFLYVL